MKRSEIIDYIKAFAPKLALGSLTAYEVIPSTSDLVDEDIPSWANVNDLLGSTVLEVTVANNTQLLGNADSGWYYAIPYANYSDYGDYPDVRVYRSSVARIWVDYTNVFGGEIHLPLPDVSDDGHTLFAYLIIITK